jgi:hypothetical protein
MGPVEKVFANNKRISRMASLRWRRRMKLKIFAGLAILAYSNVVDVRYFCADRIEASLHRERGKTRVVLNAVEALF